MSAVRRGAQLAFHVPPRLGAPQHEPFWKLLPLKVFGFWGVAVGAVLTTDIDRPQHAINPLQPAGWAAYSLAVLKVGTQRARRPRLALAAHAVNAAVQTLQLGRWATAPPLACDPGAPRTRVVVLGSGWGAITFVKNLSSRLTCENGLYDLALVSPRSHFLYTPLLPAAVTGTVQLGSIVESVRSLLEWKGSYYEAEAYAIDPVRKVVKCRYEKPFRNLDHEHAFELPYDTLVVAVGAINNTYRTPGVEQNAFFLKETGDARLLRNRVNECCEVASLPDTTPEQRKNLLTFMVCGSGPTGVEAAAELHDMLVDDIGPKYPNLKDDFAVRIISTTDCVLNMFERQIAQYADQEFARQGIDVVHHARVKEVLKDGVVVSTKGSEELQKLDASTVIWCTGIKMNPLAEQIAASMPPGTQEHVKALNVDGHLVVSGSAGTMFALGDCMTIAQHKAMEHAAELFRQGDVNGDGVLSAEEIDQLLKVAQEEYPQLSEHRRMFDIEEASTIMDELSSRMQAASSWLPAWLQSEPSEQEVAQQVQKAVDEHVLTEEQFTAHLKEIDSKLKSLPATAQLASQQGKYLADLFNRTHVGSLDARTPNGLPKGMPPFHYRHLGSFSYVGGDKAVLELARQDEKPGVFTGMLTGLAWKGMESWMQISAKNKYLVSKDWLCSKVFGRDHSDVH